MTCIIGLVQNGDVFIGADSLADYGSFVRERETKMFRREPYNKSYEQVQMVFACCGSYLMNQVLRTLDFEQNLPLHNENIESYMIRRFVPIVRAAMIENGVIEKASDSMEGSFLIGIRGHLVTVLSNFTISVRTSGYEAYGSGAPFALGSLHSTRRLQPEKRVLRALEASAEFCNTVRAPFHVEKL